MTDETTNKLIEHIVEVDDNITITLKIPKILNALELQGLMEKSKKLMNLSLTPIHQTNLGKTTGKRWKRTVYTPEINTMIKKMLKKGSSYSDIGIAINEKFNLDINYKTLYVHIKRMEG